jgi:hypothetical protein
VYTKKRYIPKIDMVQAPVVPSPCPGAGEFGGCLPASSAAAAGAYIYLQVMYGAGQLASQLEDYSVLYSHPGLGQVRDGWKKKKNSWDRPFRELYIEFPYQKEQSF